VPSLSKWTLLPVALMPPISPRFWTGPTLAVPVSTVRFKQQITLRQDDDVAAWFKERAPGGRGYQTDINRALREHIDQISRREALTRPGHGPCLWSKNVSWPAGAGPASVRATTARCD